MFPSRSTRSTWSARGSTRGRRCYDRTAEHDCHREAFVMAIWDARESLADLMGLNEEGLAVRSIDSYGDSETQVRYEQGGQAVVRLTVTGPVREMLEQEGQGLWVIKAQIGSGTRKVHSIELPEPDEIVY
jgi:hypothetical protein